MNFNLRNLKLFAKRDNNEISYHLIHLYAQWNNINQLVLRGRKKKFFSSVEQHSIQFSNFPKCLANFLRNFSFLFFFLLPFFLLPLKTIIKALVGLIISTAKSFDWKMFSKEARKFSENSFTMPLRK